LNRLSERYAHRESNSLVLPPGVLTAQKTSRAPAKVSTTKQGARNYTIPDVAFPETRQQQGDNWRGRNPPIKKNFDVVPDPWSELDQVGNDEAEGERQSRTITAGGAGPDTYRFSKAAPRLRAE